MFDVRCIQTANALLGEGPVWDPRVGALYWVDIRRPAVFRHDPLLGQTGHWPMPHPVGCVAPTRSATRLIFADAVGLGFLDLTTGRIERISEPEAGLSRNRFNDGKVDRRGCFWVGSMDDRCLDASGSLYRLDAEGGVHPKATGFVCSNGLGWSPDDRTMYFTDSMARTIWAYSFDLEKGDLGERRTFAVFRDQDGLPDGLTVDAEGYVWCAVWDGWRVIRLAPDGRIDCEIRMPVQRPTSCTFGGPDLKTLYVTSASLELDAAALSAAPLAGALFALDCQVSGLPATPFGAP